MPSNRPLIASFPAAAAIGDTVRITGQRLSGTTAVTVGGTEVESIAVKSDETLDVVIASATATGRVAVTTPRGTAASKDELVIAADAPTITLIAPASGKALDVVAVTGTGLTGATSVAIGGVEAGYTVESDTLITVTVPAAAVTGTIVVTGPAGNDASATFTYVPTPAVYSFSPTKAPAGATVVIHGSGFTAASAVAVGGTPAASFVVNSDTKITAVLGSGTTGTVAVTNSHGTGTSDGTLTVLPAATITSFTPTAGIPGTLVTVTGTNLAAASAATFNGVAARLVDATATTARVVVPAGATMGHIAVTTPAGTATSSGNFTPGSAPEIDYVSPLFAQVGDTITVDGFGLTGATSVKLGGVACTSVVVADDTSLTAVIGVATPTGAVTVATPNGTVTSEQSITIEAVPTVSSLGPTSGAVGAAVVLTGTHFAGITAVTFSSSKPAAFAVLSPTKIRATVPTGAVTGTITVTNAAGTGTSASFTVL